MALHPGLVDRSDLVLVVIDVQERLAVAVEGAEEVVAATGRLVRCAALVGAPIVVTRQYPKGLGGTVPALEGVLADVRAAGAAVAQVDKSAFCCGAEEPFREALAATGRRQAVIVGMETHICVAQSALALLGDGFRVQVAADACGARDGRNHTVALDRMRAAGAVVTTSESVMYEAVGRAGTPEFKALLEIVKGA